MVDLKNPNSVEELSKWIKEDWRIRSNVVHSENSGGIEIRRRDSHWEHFC